MLPYANLVPVAGQTNPVATLYQMNAEFVALALLESPKVIAERKLIGEQWLAAMGPFEPDSMDSFQDALGQLTFFAMMWATNDDPLVPQILRTEIPAHHWGHVAVPGTIGLINNPDTIYRLAKIDGASRYVLHGRLPATPAIDYSLSVLSPDLNTLCPPLGDNLMAAEDGSFTVTIDSSAGEPGANHLRIGPGRSQLLIRDTLSDGAIEQPMSLQLIRVDGPPVNPAPSFEELESLAVASMRIALDIALSVERLIKAETVNIFAQPVVRSFGGFLATQANNISHLIIEDGQAFVLTIAMGGAKYFAFPVNSRWQVQADFIRRQTSLNNKQASANADGTYTFVVCARDPGVHNWIDTAGMRELVLQLRWQGLPTELPEGGGPRIISQAIIPISELNNALPIGTKLVDETAREHQLCARTKSFSWMT